jgi:hypothetical protein
MKGGTVKRKFMATLAVMMIAGSVGTSASSRADAAVTADIASDSSTGILSAAQSSEVSYTGPAAGKWAFQGRDDKGVAWKGTVRITADEDGRTCLVSMQATDLEGRGVDGPCKWNSDQRELTFGRRLATFTAILSPDGNSLINGTWTESEEDDETRKATVKRTGTWTAIYTEGQAAP